MKRKHRLQKGLALLGAGVIIVGMGACTKKFEIPKVTEVSTDQVTMLEQNNVNVNTTVAIFEDPELLDITEINITNDKIEESLLSNEPEQLSTSFSKEDTFTEENSLKTRFTNQEQLEVYLEQLYYNYGKNSWQIIEEAREREASGEFYSYRNDLSASAAYMLLKDNGITLNDVALELDYLLSLTITPREELEEDKAILKVFYDICGENYNIYEIFEQLALERHMVKCPDKDKHTSNNGFIVCPKLDLEYIKFEINNKIANNEQDQSEEYELGDCLIEKIEQLTRMR